MNDITGKQIQPMFEKAMTAMIGEKDSRIDVVYEARPAGVEWIPTAGRYNRNYWYVDLDRPINNPNIRQDDLAILIYAKVSIRVQSDEKSFFTASSNSWLCFWRNQFHLVDSDDQERCYRIEDALEWSKESVEDAKQRICKWMDENGVAG